MSFLRVVAVVVAALAILVADTKPAAAHGVGGLQPTNVESRLLSTTPDVAGLELRVIELGERLELRNRTGKTVIVEGYDGEPYLRLGPDGVYENTRSPATFLNRTTRPTAPVPSSYDARARPVWRRTSGGDVARWHDHRTHYMGTGTPPAARDARGRTTSISTWELALRVGDDRVTARGDLHWVPGPPLWPAVLVACVLAGAVALVARRSWRAGVSASVTALVVAEVIHVAGTWNSAIRPVASRLGANVYSLVAIVLGLYALYRVSTRSAYDAAPPVLIAGVALFVAGGIADLNSLRFSQLPSTLSGMTERGLVVLALGLGIGVIGAAAARLRPRDTAGRQVST